MLTQHAADRLDPKPLSVLVDERDYHDKRGSSSRAKNEEAANKISLARLSSRFSRSSSLIRTASPVVVPGRRPASMSACLHHPRKMSTLTPIRCPIRTTAAFNDSSGSSARGLPDQPHRPIPQLLRVLPRCWHTNHPLVASDQSPDRGTVHRLWVADVTQHRTGEGWFYLAVVLDAFSRRVIGWAMADHMRSELVVDALQMAIWQRRPAPGAIHHADHGSQYTSWAFGQRLHAAGLLGSMGSVGDALDNALVESFFASLQTELLNRSPWASPAELAGAVFAYLEGFYNPTRRHSALGYLSPADYEKAATRRPAEQRHDAQAPHCPSPGTRGHSTSGSSPHVLERRSGAEPRPPTALHPPSPPPPSP